MSGSSKFMLDAKEIERSMQRLVDDVGISVNIVPVPEDDPDKAIEITRANFARIQDAIETT